MCPKEALSPLSRWFPLAAALTGTVLMLVVQPPLGWWPLVFVAPAPWLWLAWTTTEGRRGYVMLWLAAFAQQLVLLHWIRYPHPLLWLAWVALAAYLASYVPLASLAIRTARVRWHLPLWTTAPLVAVGCEYAMSHFLSGFTMGLPGHVLVHSRHLRQIADLGGCYTLTLLVNLVAAALTQWLCPAGGKSKLWGSIAAAIAMGTAIVYGSVRTSAESSESVRSPEMRIALLQGNRPAVWQVDEHRDLEVMREYTRLTHRAVLEASRLGRPLDLVVWPESMFRTGLFDFEPGHTGLSQPTMTNEVMRQFGREQLAALARDVGTATLVGIDRAVGIPDQQGDDTPRYKYFNSVAAVSAEGQLVGTYDKSHLVAFGEYIPLLKFAPWLYRYTPMAGGLEEGDGPIAIPLAGTTICPSICYETVLPHVIRRQVATLHHAGTPPKLLVNVTNDAWFRDSCQLELHLACARLRAIECRTPLVVAANGGLSAAIDATGGLLAVSRPQTAEVLMASIRPSSGFSPYLLWGDWLGLGCLIFTAACILRGWKS